MDIDRLNILSDIAKVGTCHRTGHCCHGECPLVDKNNKPTPLCEVVTLAYKMRCDTFNDNMRAAARILMSTSLREIIEDE